jgi:hypothetical protein
MIFGEFGVNDDVASATRTADYEVVQGLVAARADNAGALAWSCYDVNTSDNQFGLYASRGVQRSDICIPFATFPTTR